MVGAAPLFASTDVADVARQGFPESWRCARGDYSDQCRYVDRSARPARIVQAPSVQVRRCALVTAYGQSWCDDRESEREEKPEEKKK